MTPPATSRALAALFLFFLGFYALFAGGHLYTGDARTVLLTDLALLDGQGAAIPFDRSLGGSFGPDGRFYGQYGLGAVITGLLPAWLGRLVAPNAASPAERLAADFPFSLWNIPFAAGTVTLLAATLLRLGHRLSSSLAVSAWTGLATMLWPYAARDFTEPQASFFLLLGFFLVLEFHRTGRSAVAAAAGCAIGWALLTKIYVVVVAPIFLLFVWWRARNLSAAAAFAAPLGLAALAIAGYNHARFGSPLSTGYAAAVQNTHIPLLHGVFGLLFSSGKSFFIFNPPALLAFAGARELDRRLPDVSRFVWALAVVHVTFFGIQQNWDGDWCWGPRYLLPLVPFLAIPAAAWLEPLDAVRPARRYCAVVLVAAGLFVQTLGVAISPNDYVRYLTSRKAQLGDYLPEYKDKRYVPFHHHHWNPDLSPLRGHWMLLRSALGSPPSRVLLYSTAEEWNDEGGHRLLPFVDLGPPGELGEGLDFWFSNVLPAVEPRHRDRLLLPYGLAALILTCAGLPRLMRAYRLSKRAEASSP